MLPTEPERSTSKSRARRASLSLRPENVRLSIPLTAKPHELQLYWRPVAVLGLGPRSTLGIVDCAVHSLVAPKRNSTPPLKACLPRFQLRLFPNCHRGLTLRTPPLPA